MALHNYTTNRVHLWDLEASWLFLALLGTPNSRSTNLCILSYIYLHWNQCLHFAFHDDKHPGFSLMINNKNNCY